MQKVASKLTDASLGDLQKLMDLVPEKGQHVKMELDHERLHQHHLPSSEDQVKVGVAITLLQGKKEETI